MQPATGFVSCGGVGVPSHCCVVQWCQDVVPIVCWIQQTCCRLCMNQTGTDVRGVTQLRSGITAHTLVLVGLTYSLQHVGCGRSRYLMIWSENPAMLVRGAG
jgi:hypothetical protein